MPPFSPVPEQTKRYVMFGDFMNGQRMPQHFDAENKMSTDSQDMPYKPLISKPSSSSSLSMGTASTSCTSLSSSESSAATLTSSASPSSHQSNKMKRNVSFRQDISDVLTIEAIHHPQDVHNQWYSKRELHIIRHKIRSLLRWHNMRDAHYYQYEDPQEEEQAEYYEDGSQDSPSGLRNAPPPPAPPCVTFYEECLFGLEKHLSQEKEQVREIKYNAQSVVFGEQELQKQMGLYDEHRLAYSYAQTSAASQQEAWEIAQLNAQESELHRQELEAQQRLQEEQQRHLQQQQERRESEQRKIESFETSLLSQEECDLEHLFLREGRRENPLNVLKNWRACFGKLFRPRDGWEIDSDEDCLNAPPRVPKRHGCLFSDSIQEDEEGEDENEYYHR
ncbi:unnamed protein product [Cylindrotheca closterium]|uniref:Uncharacterized protein n=1 Tax=Cylindrotheca closterium TaxID=2856 RepID=A0AAD2CRT9_9STRA|nr:unnamed protein product [Cylindrotheca closterium]